MPTTQKLADIEGALQQFSAIAGTIQPWIPALTFAVTSLWNLFHKANPTATPEDYIAWLKSEGTNVQNLTADWLTSHGYVLVNGEWQTVAPASPPPPPSS